MSYTNQNQKKSSFLDDYVGVDELIEQMNTKYPEGVLKSEIIDISDNYVVFKTSFFINSEASLKCTGHARVEKTPANPHWFEKAETKSRGRCLRVLLSAGVTKEEMEDVDLLNADKPVNKTADNVLDIPVDAAQKSNSAVDALKDIQQSVTGGKLLQLLNDSLADCELQQVNTLSSAKEELLKLGGADSVLLANTIKEKYAKINA